MEVRRYLTLTITMLLVGCGCLMSQDNGGKNQTYQKSSQILPNWNEAFPAGNQTYGNGTSQDEQNQGYSQGKWGEGKGPTFTELFSGFSSNVSGMLKFDTSVGWNFTRNFGFDAGVPYFLETRPGLFAGTAGRLGYVSTPFLGCTFFFGCYTGVATSSRLWAGELGDVYGDIHYTRPYKRYNLATVLTGDAPTSSYRKGMTSGRVQWDWYNHVDTGVHGFTPFLNFGIANGRMDQHFLPRPPQYRSAVQDLGLHLQLRRRVGVQGLAEGHHRGFVLGRAAHGTTEDLQRARVGYAGVIDQFHWA